MVTAMKKTILYEIDSLYRDNFRVTGYSFGKGEKALCIIGSIRGNEIQQIYTCSLLVKRLKELEEQKKLPADKEILVIPSGNPYSINIQKRFWSTDNTDINRMFPGYNKGETTQRIADGIFQIAKEYKTGIQLASFYMTGEFMPHVRMMTTGNENTELAKDFGLPYIILRNSRPYDTTTLNYNLQLWDTDAFSLYTTRTSSIDKKGALIGIESIFKFMANNKLLKESHPSEIESKIVEDKNLISARVSHAGILETYVHPGESVRKGQLLATIVNPYDGETIERIVAPDNGIVFFMCNEPLIYANTAAFKLIPIDVNIAS